MATAKRTNAIAASLFPSNVRDRMFKDAEEQAERDILNKTKMGAHASGKNRLKDYLDEADEGKPLKPSRSPICFPIQQLCLRILLASPLGALQRNRRRCSLSSRRFIRPSMR
jgi:hypothetical protein